MCQIYDQDSSNQDKSSFRGNTSVLLPWIPETRVVLNYWFLVNVGLQAVKKLARESWVYSLKKFNLHPKHRVSFSQWFDRINLFLQ